MGKCSSQQVCVAVISEDIDKLTIFRYWEANLATGHVPSEALVPHYTSYKYIYLCAVS